MTKADIIELIAEKTGFTIKDIKVVVEGFIDEVKKSLTEDKHIEIRGFGTFKVKKHKARKARNPRTNQEVMVPERKKAFFKVSKEMNKSLN